MVGGIDVSTVCDSKTKNPVSLKIIGIHRDSSPQKARVRNDKRARVSVVQRFSFHPNYAKIETSRETRGEGPCAPVIQRTKESERENPSRLQRDTRHVRVRELVYHPVYS